MSCGARRDLALESDRIEQEQLSCCVRPSNRRKSGKKPGYILYSTLGQMLLLARLFSTSPHNVRVPGTGTWYPTDTSRTCFLLG